MLYWRLPPSTKVSFDLILRVKAKSELKSGLEIIKISMRTVDEGKIDAKVKPFEENTKKTVMVMFMFMFINKYMFMGRVM